MSHARWRLTRQLWRNQAMLRYPSYQFVVPCDSYVHTVDLLQSLFISSLLKVARRSHFQLFHNQFIA